AWFLVEAHRLRSRVAHGDAPAPMRLFHQSIAYLTLLFAAVAVSVLLPFGQFRGFMTPWLMIEAFRLVDQPMESAGSCTPHELAPGPVQEVVSRARGRRGRGARRRGGRGQAR